MPPLSPPINADPRPIEPEKPLPCDCCDSGCDRCVFELYAEEMAGYEQRLAAWQERNAGVDPK